MGTNHYAYAAVCKAGKERTTLFLGGVAGEKGALHARGLKILLDISIVLICKHFRWCHYAGLIAVANGDEAAEHRNHRFSGTHIALQKAVHLMAAGKV